MSKFLLMNSEGKVIRTLNWSGEQGYFVQRHDLGRLEFVEDLAALRKEEVEFSEIVQIRKAELASGKTIPGVGRLISSTAVEHKEFLAGVQIPEEPKRIFWRSMVTVSVGAVVFVIAVSVIPKESAKLEEELKQHVVKIVRRAPVKPPVTVQVSRQVRTFSQETSTTRSPTPKVTAVKRIGVLGILGRLSKGKQSGGVDLSAAQTTAGPGLGGSAGSGGVQTTLYGKGLIAAPLGVGGNLQGAGGYGTKGKGGGRDGIGKLALIGSNGSSPIPLGHEAMIEGGLDRDLIAQVIQRNLGQIRFCYEQGLQSDPSLAGRVAVDFTIGKEGVVQSASIGSTNLQSNTVESCILRRLRSWKFPTPDGGVNVKVSYPFVLRRAGNG